MRELDAMLKALLTSESFNKAVQYSDDLFTPDAEYFLIRYDNETKEVSVSPYRRYSTISDQLITEEKAADEADSPKNAVLVEADAIEDLKAAYPNYFLDVQMFVARAARYLS